MKLSTKGRYATRFMLDLALNVGEHPVLLKDVAARQNISEKYLGNLIQPLKAAGLINSSRGAHGGYSLAKEPADIDLAQIVKAVEGDMSIVECVFAPDVCNRVEDCVSRDIWVELTERIIAVLKSTTLEYMAAQQKEKKLKHELMYHI